MDSAIRSLGQGFAQDLLRTRRAGGDYHHLAAMLFFLAQGFLESIGVGLINLVGDVFANPRTTLIKLQWGILLRDLLDADQDLQRTPLQAGLPKPEWHRRYRTRRTTKNREV
jgi:hypothetical protein